MPGILFGTQSITVGSGRPNGMTCRRSFLVGLANSYRFVTY